MRRRDYHGKGKVQTSAQPLLTHSMALVPRRSRDSPPGFARKEQWLPDWTIQISIPYFPIICNFLQKNFMFGPGNHVAEIDHILRFVQEKGNSRKKALTLRPFFLIQQDVCETFCCASTLWNTHAETSQFTVTNNAILRESFIENRVEKI